MARKAAQIDGRVFDEVVAGPPDERCKSCSHWTERKSEFSGWQLCDAKNKWVHAADWCRDHKGKA